MSTPAAPSRPARVILHVDMDAFFASVEQLDDPALRGKPVLVGGSGKRGVVAAASYEARVFGCRSAMPTAVARRLCPHAIIVRGRFDRYRELSDTVFDILRAFSPQVQPLSIDEAFLDATGSTALFGDGRAIAEQIRARIRTETGLTASVGVAPNKFLAKLASDLDKPDGLVVIEPGRVRETLDPLPVSRIPGLGPAGEQRLARLGVRTIAQLCALSEAAARGALGSFGPRAIELARGIDDRPVHADHEAKTIGHEQTFGEDLDDADEVRAVLMSHVEAVARRLRRHERLARGITLKIRYGNFETITRAATLDEPTSRTDLLWNAAQSVFDQWVSKEGFRPVRLIGFTATQLATPDSASPGLFGQQEEQRRSALDRATDAINERFGKAAITRGRSLTRPKRSR